MTDTTGEILARKWRQDLLELKDRVKQTNLSTEQAFSIAQKLKTENQAKSVKPNCDIQNAHIQLCDSIEQAFRIFEDYRSDNLPFNTTTFNVLISLSPDKTTAKSFFNTLLDFGLKPNTYTFNGFIPFSKTVEDGREVIRSMNKYQVKPNTQTYNTLLSLTTSDEQRAEIITAMEDQGIDLNIVTFNTLISRSITFKGAINYYHDMKSRNFKPTINTFITFLKLAKTSNEIKQTEKRLRNENITPNSNWNKLRNTKIYG